jgi:hypothetical protein
VKVDQHMGTDPLAHYVWLYQGPQWKQKVYAAGALAIIMAIVMFPLWPITLRLGVWYLSMGLLGLLGLFFLMAIFRLILFCITVFTVKPGLWLFPNLFEDVGVIDSFKPLWGWQPVSLTLLPFSPSVTPPLLTLPTSPLSRRSLRAKRRLLKHQSPPSLPQPPHWPRRRPSQPRPPPSNLPLQLQMELPPQQPCRSQHQRLRKEGSTQLRSKRLTTSD